MCVALEVGIWCGLLWIGRAVSLDWLSEWSAGGTVGLQFRMECVGMKMRKVVVCTYRSVGGGVALYVVDEYVERLGVVCRWRSCAEWQQSG